MSEIVRKLSPGDLARLVVGRLKGPTVVAEMLGISDVSIHHWYRKGIPADRRRYLQLERPDVFVGTPYEVKCEYQVEE